jgi:hypothetical protein
MSFIFLFGCCVWIIWIIRNNFVFNNVVLPSPELAVFPVISFMQRWMVIYNAVDWPALEAMREGLSTSWACCSIEK